MTTPSGGQAAFDDVVIERLARAYHERYRRSVIGTPQETDIALAEWDELSPEVKESNRQSARALPGHLAELGLTARPVAPTEALLTVAIDSAEVERVARLEHERWADVKRADGWRFGPERDDAAKLHPMLIPYDELDEPTKDLDRDRIRAIPSLLAACQIQVNATT